MAGGSGSDRYAVDSTGDVVVEAYGAGTDLVKSSLSFTLVANVEHLTLSGLRAINGTGNWLNNNIYGNSAANILSGAGGHDYLDGAAGGDKLLGGSGNDALLGGSGGDQLFGGLGSDLVSGGLGNDVMHGGAGLDAFRFERGQDRIADFQVGLDELGFDDSLYGNRLISEDEVLGYGRISGGNAVFDFGNGNVLTLVGVNDLDDLRGYLYYF
jgi:serralysin